MTIPLLSQRQLNRTLLARQHLSRRVDWPPKTMIARLVGLQAQAPDAPYVALWNRLRDYRPDALSAMVAERRLLRLTMMRSTIHLIDRDEGLRFRPLLQPMIMGKVMGAGHRSDLRGMDLDQILDAARSILAGEPLTRAELSRRLTERWPDRDGAQMSFLAIMALPTEQATPRGIWRAADRTRWRLIPELDVWPAPSRDTVPELLRRYLAAFGPASLRDMARWSGLSGLRPVIEAMRPELRPLRGPAGEELFDLPDGVIADPGTPAPVRFLPEFDNILLSHHDRGRILPARHTPPLPAGDGGRSGTLLIDGMFCGTWGIAWHKDDTALLTAAPFAPLTANQADELHQEAAALMAFIAPDTTSWELDLLPASEPVAGRHGMRT